MRNKPDNWRPIVQSRSIIRFGVIRKVVTYIQIDVIHCLYLLMSGLEKNIFQLQIKNFKSTVM